MISRQRQYGYNLHPGFFVSLLLPALATVMRMRKKQPTVQTAATGSATAIHRSAERTDEHGIRVKYGRNTVPE